MLERQEVFALVSAFLAGAEKEATSLVAEFETPLVGPFTLRPHHELPINPFVFYLLPGVDTQARVLVQSAAEFVGHPPRAAVVFLEGAGYGATVRGMVEEAAEAAWPDVEIFSYPRGSMKPAALVAELKQSAIEALFLLVPGEDQAALLRAAEALAWHTRVFLPVALAGREIGAAPKRFSGKLFIAVPMLPSDQSQAGARQYRDLAAKYELPMTYRPIQLATLGAARVLVEGLKRAGRDLSRDRLVEALEGLYEFETGLTPPVTYGPNRRLAARGAHVMSADLQRGQFLRTGGWRALR